MICSRAGVFLPVLITLLIVTVAFSGCKGRTQNEQNSTDSVKTQLSIGLIPEQNIFRQRERYMPLARYLSSQTHVDIELKMLPRYGNIVSNFLESKLDGAFLGSFTYCLIRMNLDVHPIARPEKHDGTSTYYGMIFVRKDSGITTGAEMKGKRFAFVDRATTAGYLLPLHYFKEQGIDDYHNWFSEIYFTGTHEDTIYDVLNGKADVGAAKNTVFYRLAEQNPLITEDLKILAESPRVPENGLALRNNLDPKLIENIKEALLTMNTTSEGQKALAQLGAARFIETRDEDYGAVYEFAKDVGINLSDYDYLND